MGYAVSAEGRSRGRSRHVQKIIVQDGRAEEQTVQAIQHPPVAGKERARVLDPRPALQQALVEVAQDPERRPPAPPGPPRAAAAAPACPGPARPGLPRRPPGARPGRLPPSCGARRSEPADGGPRRDPRRTRPCREAMMMARSRTRRQAPWSTGGTRRSAAIVPPSAPRYTAPSSVPAAAGTVSSKRRPAARVTASRTRTTRGQQRPRAANPAGATSTNNRRGQT